MSLLNVPRLARSDDRTQLVHEPARIAEMVDVATRRAPVSGMVAASFDFFVDWERRQLIGGETAEWAAMQRAGRGIAAAILRDAAEAGGLRPAARLLVLAGKGHNGGDALLAARALLAATRSGSATTASGGEPHGR